MKVMLDKEFDKAIRSSFDDFEVEPTAKSWENISAQLNEKRKGKKLPIFWLSVAASVVIVLSIGISIYQKPTDDIIKLRAQEKPKDVVIEDGLSSQAANKKNSNIGDKEVVLNDIDKSEILANSSVEADKNQVETAKYSASEKNIAIDATITPKENVLETNEVVAVITDIKPLRRPTVTERMIAEENAKSANSINNQTALARNTNDENLSNEGAQSDRKVKIKTVGDLVNFVVAQVDKREEKIIKVSKTEESDNEITGINLGLFKFRKAEK
jgi:hypothetical protein